VSLFVDTSAWYAAADRDDTNNSVAQAILSKSEQFITTDHVLVESWTLIRHRLNREAAQEFWNGLRGGVATVEVVSVADIEAAWNIGETFADQDFSIVDRTSFAVMVRLGLERVASFDSDFSVFRYGRRREKAFQVVR
jgi:predicted nucleic acid-binding protein